MLSRAIPAPCPCSASAPALLPVRLCPLPVQLCPLPVQLGAAALWFQCWRCCQAMRGTQRDRVCCWWGKRVCKPRGVWSERQKLSPWDAFIVLVLGQSEFGNIHQLDVPEEPEHDPGWWQMARGPAGRCLLLPSRGKVRARGACASISPQDRSQRVPLTSKVTPPAPSVPLQAGAFSSRKMPSC